jgi:hypothetical protein
MAFKIVELAKDQRLRVEPKVGGILECHLEQINKNGNWNGRAWFHLTITTINELAKISASAKGKISMGVEK